MKSIVLYSSRTGNTKKVAEAIASAVGGDIRAVHDRGDLSSYDVVFVGFWAFRRGADMEARQAIGEIHGKKTAVFGTAGAYPDSEAAHDYVANAAALFPSDNTYLGGFICQGRVHSFHTGRRSAHTEAVHPLTPERRARLEEAEKHPDEEDLQKAAAFGQDILKKAAEIE